MSNWEQIFNHILIKLESGLACNSDLAKEIMLLYQGEMGTFMDLVLQKDEKMLFDENAKLSELKK